MSAITIPTRYSNIFDGTREEYSRLARKFLTNKDNFQNGKQSLKNFTKIYGYLKEGNVIKGAVLSQGNITFPDKLKQNISRQKSEKKRESNLKGLTPEIRKQIDFLNETTAVEEEYEADSNNPDAGKIRDGKMKALWKKYRRQEKYDSTKTYKWKEGKSEKGYLAWQNKVFNDLKGGEGVDVDHGKSGARGGTNSRTNLSLQESNWNRWIKGNKVELQRTDEQYDEAGIAFDKDRSFQEYLAFEDDPNIKLVTDLGLEGMTDIHKRVGVDVNAVIAQNEQRLQEEVYQEQIEESYKRSLPSNNQLHNKLSIGANTHDLWKNGAIAVGKSPIANELTGGLTGKIVDINNAIEDTLSGNPKKAIPTFLSLATQALTTTEDTAFRALKTSENY